MPRFLPLLVALFALLPCSRAASAAHLDVLDKAAWAYAKREWEQPPTFRVFWRSVGGPTKGPSLRIRATLPGWDTTLTRTVLFASPPARVEFTGAMRLENVERGPEAFMSARAQLQFLDARAEMLGGWPAGELRHGTLPWFTFTQTHRPPAGTRAATLTLGLVNATGLVEYADLTLRAFAANGAEIPITPPSAEVRTDTTAWWPLTDLEEDRSRPLALDLAALLGAAPLGPTDALQNRAGELVRADGSTLRLWGTNIGPPHAWPEPAEGARMAERLAREGVNLVRLHHLDRGWHPDNIFVAGSDHTQALDPEKLDRLHRFVAELRARGIYLAVDLLVTRRFRPGDEVPAHDELEFGAKMAAHFHPRVIELQKDYARRLLTAPNPHTGHPLATDPAVVFVSLVNESSLFLDGAISSYAKLPAPYHVDLLARFHAHQGTRSLPVPPGSVSELFKRRDPDFWRFLETLQTATYAELTAHLRDELGVRALIGGSNFIETLADFRSNAGLDYLDAHAYWDHPVGGWSVTDPITNQSVLRRLARPDQPLAALARRQALDLPFAASEWAACWPNDHLAEFPLLLATTAAGQGWDAPMWFGLTGLPPAPAQSGVFDQDNKPHARLAAALAALAFRRGDFPLLPVSIATTPSLPPWDNLKNLHPGDAHLTHRLLWSPAGATPATADATPPSNALRLLEPGLAVIESPRTRATLGELSLRPAVSAGPGFQVSSPAAFAVVAATSLDSAPLENSRRVLLYIAARVENSGQTFRPFRRGLLSVGGPPMLAEPVRGHLTLARADPRPHRLVPLDLHGRRAGPGTVHPVAPDGTLTLPLDPGPALWFELSAEP